MIFLKFLSCFHIIFRFLEASKTFIKSKSLSLSFAFSLFSFVGQNMNEIVLIKNIRKGDK